MVIANSSGSERRRHGRVKMEDCFQAVRLDPDGVNTMDTLSGIDISRSGVGAFSSRSYYPGQRLVICLPVAGNHGHRNLYATIVRSSGVQGGYAIGLKFDSASADQWVGVSTLAAA
ncbi:MAG: PilZ domain-containing protein [Planctomycetaceae bacterium]|nr:PilZ domain-containing protein [Planctomycetaceae bacterium]